MSGVEDYRSREEIDAQESDSGRIRAVLEQAVTDGASLLVAIELGEPAAVIELWTDRLWDGLRDNLSDDRPRLEQCPGMPREDRLTAITLLLQDRMSARAERTLAEVREATS